MESTERSDLIEALKGQTVHVPDLHKYMPDWPHGVNPEVERLRKDVDDRLDR